MAGKPEVMARSGLLESLPVASSEPSRPAADATREANGAVVA